MTPEDNSMTTLAGADLLFVAMDEVFPVDKPEPFTAPPVVPVEARDAVYMGKAASWCAKSLEGYAETLAAMAPNSGRNHYLNKAGWRLNRFALAGHLDMDAVTVALRDAALECGLGVGEIEATLASAHRAAYRDGPQEPPVTGVGKAPDPFDLLGVVVDETTGEVVRPMTVEELLQQRHERKVAEELAILRARDEAKRLFTAERAALEFREPPSVLTLREQLLLPRDPVQMSIAELLPRGGNALLTAQFKAGKTTVNTSLLRSVADGEPFLGRYDVQQHDGRIAIFNYELSQQQYDQWLEDAGIVNTDKVSVLHLRGFRLDIRVPRVEDWIVRWLAERDVKTWIADPFARAAVGVDENSNTEVGVWLDTFDVIKERAGVIDGVLTTHTGRAEQESGQERARGATRLDDWADVRWILTRDDNGTRFFRATGRDVEVGEEKLTYDDTTRRLTIGGGDRNWERRRHLEEVVVAYVKAHPGSSGAAVEAGVEGKGTAVRAALKGAVAGHRLRVEDGAKGASLHYSNE